MKIKQKRYKTFLLKDVSKSRFWGVQPSRARVVSGEYSLHVQDSFLGSTAFTCKRRFWGVQPSSARFVSGEYSFHVQDSSASFCCLSSLGHIEHMTHTFHVRNIERKKIPHSVRTRLETVCNWPVLITLLRFQRALWKSWPKAKQTIQHVVIWVVHEPSLYTVSFLFFDTFHLFLLLLPLRFSPFFWSYSPSRVTPFSFSLFHKRIQSSPNAFTRNPNHFHTTSLHIPAKEAIIKRSRYEDIEKGVVGRNM